MIFIKNIDQHRKCRESMSEETYSLGGLKMNMLHRDKDWLEKKYIKEGLSLRDIADLVGVSYETVRAWLLRFGIPIRNKNEHRKRKPSLEEAIRVLQSNGKIKRPDTLPAFESEGERRLRKRAELRAKIRRDNEAVKEANPDSWHDGDAGEEMDRIQEQADSVESSGKKPEKATKKEKAHIESRGS